MNVSHEQIKSIIKLHTTMRSATPLCIWGEHGIGKTETVRQVAEENKFKFIYTSAAQWTEPGDILGLPKMGKKDNGEEYTTYALPDWFPYELKDGENGILFFDDFNRANREVLAALMQALQLKRVGQFNIPKGWFMVLSANPETTYDVTPIDPAMKTRMSSLTLTKNKKAWVNYSYESGVHPAVTKFFVIDNEDYFHAMCPRTLSQLSTALHEFEAYNAKYKVKAADADKILRPLIGQFLENEDAVFQRFKSSIKDSADTVSGGEKTIVGSITAKFIEHYKNLTKFTFSVGDILEHGLTEKMKEMLETMSSNPDVKFASNTAGYQIAHGMRDTGFVIKRLFSRREEVINGSMDTETAKALNKRDIKNAIEFVFKWTKSPDIRAAFVKRVDNLDGTLIRIQREIQDHPTYKQYVDKTSDTVLV